MIAVVLFDNSKLFRDIAQAKSVSRGASQNGISQSAASQHLQELEKRLGVSLLDRTTRPLTLTVAGKLYFDLCRDVLRREEEFEAALDELKARVEGEVRVASIYSIGLSEMSRLQEEFARRCPNAQHICLERRRRYAGQSRGLWRRPTAMTMTVRWLRCAKRWARRHLPKRGTPRAG